MVGGRITRAAAVAALCGGLALSGCSGDRDTGEGRKIEAAVKRFALSHGRETCNLMSHRELARVYGGKSDNPVVGKANCLARSPRFRGQPVEVTFVKLKSSTDANATARTLDGHRYWSVGLLKHRGQWLIQSVAAIQRPG
jgi:hypothetical protein